MKLSRAGTSGFPIRPSVCLTIVYVGACAIWFLWILCTARYPKVGFEGVFRIIGDGPFLAATAINGLLVLLLVADGFQARQAPPGLRRGQLAGILLAGVGLALVELALIYAHAPLTAA